MERSSPQMNSMVTLLLAVSLAGCAGSPVGIHNAPGAKTVTINGTAIVVAPIGKDQFAATHLDFLANNTIVSPADYLRRKADFAAAIEAVSGCPIVDSVGEPGGATLHATVKC